MSTKLVRLAAALSLFLFQSAGHAAKLPGHETVKVADGVYAFISAESNNAIVGGNSVAVIGDDGVLAVREPVTANFADSLAARAVPVFPTG